MYRVYPIATLKNIVTGEISLCRLERLVPSPFRDDAFQPYHLVDVCSELFANLTAATAHIVAHAACGEHCCPLGYIDRCFGWDGHNLPQTYVFLPTARYI